jgi:hypothetical protein
MSLKNGLADALHALKEMTFTRQSLAIIVDGVTFVKTMVGLVNGNQGIT